MKLKNLNNSIRRIARNTLLTILAGTATTANLPSKLYAQESITKKLSPQTKQVDNPSTEEKGIATRGLVPLPIEELAGERPKYIGSIYGEIGKVGGIFDENPAMLNMMLGYNILNDKVADGVLLFPTVRSSIKGNKPDLSWGNYLDVGVGVAHLKEPFIVGIEEVYRHSFKKEGIEGDFLRAWAAYWSRYESKELVDFEKYPNRFWITDYGELEFNTLEDNLAATLVTDINLDMVNLNSLVIGPYVQGKLNYGTSNKPWNRYGQASVGLKLRKGAFQLTAEIGERNSFNEEGLEGSYTQVAASFWRPF